MAQPQAPYQQQGGVVYSLQTLLANMDSPSKLIYAFVVILLIVYAPAVSMEYRSFADSILGRIFGIGLVYGVIEMMGWVYGLLTAMAFLLLLFGAPRSSMTEGFDGGGSVSEKKAVGKRWFVEKVLGERTSKIATDRVTTNAITD
uniref:Uncharacterized protein n=1 Tax=viral metagenome TaxID=1070528 RepID=A0A6C0KUT4_9ZZZZ